MLLFVRVLMLLSRATLVATFCEIAMLISSTEFVDCSVVPSWFTESMNPCLFCVLSRRFVLLV